MHGRDPKRSAPGSRSEREARARRRRQEARRAERARRGLERRRALRRGDPTGTGATVTRVSFERQARRRGEPRRRARAERADPGGRPARERTSAPRRVALGALLLFATATLGWLSLDSVEADVAAEPATPAAVAVAGGATPLERASARLFGALHGAPRVGIQIGHLDTAAHPEELAGLRWSTGGSANGIAEVDVNRAVAAALAARLDAAGVAVDVLPATVPPGYRADALLALHADSSPDPARRGYKSAYFEPLRNRLDPQLKAALDDAYRGATGLPDDHENVSGNMVRYYAFNGSYRHAVSPRTPAVLVEMGYISNRDDLDLLQRPDAVAAALARGVVAYLHERGRIDAEAAALAVADRIVATP